MAGKRVDIDKLAAALWTMERFPDAGLDMPAFQTYADGRQEGCPLHEQDEDFQAYWKGRVRRVLRAVRRAERGSPLRRQRTRGEK